MHFIYSWLGGRDSAAIRVICGFARVDAIGSGDSLTSNPGTLSARSARSCSAGGSALLASHFDVLDNLMSDVQSAELGGEKPSRCPFHCGERQARISRRCRKLLFDICAELRSRPRLLARSSQQMSETTDACLLKKIRHGPNGFFVRHSHHVSDYTYSAGLRTRL